MRRLPVPALLGLALVALPPLSAGTQQARVVALDDVFDPSNPKLSLGSTVTFVNQGDTNLRLILVAGGLVIYGVFAALSFAVASS
jgi:hypothetical protein